MQSYFREFSLSRCTACTTGVAALLLSSVALSHTGGEPGHAHFGGLWSGWMHPFTGLDHLLAMFAVGMWAGQSGGRATWIVPAGFVALMAVGGLAAMAGSTIPAIESGILASLIVLGLAIAAAIRVPASIGAAAVGLFAIFHGAAHGLEMPSGTAATFSAGFMLATATLHLGGVFMARTLQRCDLAFVTRLAGAAVGVAGLLLIAN